MACGSLALMSSTVAVCGTTSENTRASRTRRAISWAYCAPKSTTRTGRACSASVTGLTLSSLPATDFSGDLPGHLGLDDERQHGHEADQHDPDHPRQAPAHLEPEVGRGEDVDEVEDPVDRAPGLRRLGVAQHVVDEDDDAQDEQRDTGHDRHHLVEAERLADGLRPCAVD